jgi:hypothetical protein
MERRKRRKKTKKWGTGQMIKWSSLQNSLLQKIPAFDFAYLCMMYHWQVWQYHRVK